MELLLLLSDSNWMEIELTLMSELLGIVCGFRKVDDAVAVNAGDDAAAAAAADRAADRGPGTGM